MTSPADKATDDVRGLVERLKTHEKKSREYITNSEAVVEAFKDQLARFEARDGSHNTYAVRLAVDHQSSIRTEAKYADDFAEAAATILSLLERAERAERERDERREADQALVDKYRNPATGVFNFPTDVAAIVRRLDAAEARIKELEQDAVKSVQHVSRADLAAGWEIVGLPRMGRHICWVTDHHELVPTLDALAARGTLIASVIPVAAFRRARSMTGGKG